MGPIGCAGPFGLVVIRTKPLGAYLIVMTLGLLKACNKLHENMFSEYNQYDGVSAVYGLVIDVPVISLTSSSLGP